MHVLTISSDNFLFWVRCILNKINKFTLSKYLYTSYHNLCSSLTKRIHHTCIMHIMVHVRRENLPQQMLLDLITSVCVRHLYHVDNFYSSSASTHDTVIYIVDHLHSASHLKFIVGSSVKSTTQHCSKNKSCLIAGLPYVIFICKQTKISWNS